MRERRVWRWVKMNGLLGTLCVGVLGAVTHLASAQQPTVATHDQRDTHAGDAILARPVTLTLTRVPLKDAIDTVARVAHVLVQYETPLLRAYSSPVSLSASNTSLGVVFERLLDGTNLRIVSDAQGDLTIVPLADRLADSVPQLGSISGRVVDSATGHGLPGVTVKVAGMKLSALTQDSGRFTLRNIPVGQQIVTAKGFGYRPGERTVTVSAAQATPILVRLVQVPNVLSGVVTTATGVQRKVEVGNDITTLNVDSVMQVAPISSVTDLLATRVPGLTVVHSSGVPGDPARLRLRGPGSIQLNNDPIVIVDGIRVYASQSDPRNQNLAPTHQAGGGGPLNGVYNAPSPLDQIDPSSIETIEVLKGPSASAIYGSDAASGVIVITTKKGRAGPAHWDVNLASGLNWLPGDWPTNYYRFGYNVSRVGPICNWYTIGCKVDSVVTFQALNDPRYSVFSHGNDQQASLTVSGGVPTLTYSIIGSTQATLGNLKLPGSEVQRYDSLYGPIPHALIRPDKYSTWGVTGTLTAIPQPTLTAAFQSSLFNSTQRRSSLESAITQLAGEYLSPTALLGPLISGEYERVTSDQVTSTNTATLQWQPKSWLPLSATAGLNTMQSNDVSYVPFGVRNENFGGDCSSNPSVCGDTTGSYGLGRGTSRVTTLTVGTRIPAFRDKITTAVGGNFYSTSTADMQVYTRQLAPGVTAPTTFTALCANGTVGCYSPTTASTSAQSTYGWYVEPRLNVLSKLFVSPGFRLDGGSGAAKNSSTGGLSGFPKMDLSYLAVDRQDERPLWGVLTQLRPRVSYGYAGTQPAPADKLRLYNLGGAVAYNNSSSTGTLYDGCFSTVTLDGTTGTPAVCLNTLGNSLLHPERSSELEGGFDAELWQNRVGITVSQYNKTRHDAILSIPVAQSVISNNDGNFFSIQKNIGVVRNTGTEITLNATPIQHRALSWTISGNFSKNTNVVVRLNKGQNPIILVGSAGGLIDGLQTRVQAGYPLFASFARPITGYIDANGDGIIEKSEIRYGDSTVYLGSSEPNYQLNVSNDVSLLNGTLGLHMAIAYENGLTQFNGGSCDNGSFLFLPNNPATPLATQAAVVAAGCSSGLSHIGGGTASPIGLVQTVNALRFQSLSINYVVPTRVAHWARVPRMTVALQGNNLGLHSSYRGKDPDVNAFSTVSAGDQTADTGQIPQPRTWLLHVTLGN